MLVCLTVSSSVTLAQSDAASPRLADTVLVGGKVATLDAVERFVEGVAVQGDRIAAVGSAVEMQPWIGPETRVIDLTGRTVVPGIIETHCHPMGVATAELEQPYADLKSIGEVQAWLRRRAREVPAGEWIRIPRTEITRLVERRFPTPAELDAATTKHPVQFTSVRKHVFNSLGFERIGVASDGAAIPGGTIIHDEAGRPWLVAGAEGYLAQRTAGPQFPRDETLKMLERVFHRYNELGITSIFDRATDRAGYDTYRELASDGRLTVRVTTTFRNQFQSAADVESYVARLGLKPRQGDEWVRAGPLKITLDGGIHWGNTLLSEPYGQRRIDFYRLVDPEYRGDARFTTDQMQAIFGAAERLGWQMSVHVTGDAGVERVLDALERVNRERPLKDSRFTFIHAYFPTDELARRAAGVGACVDTQTYLYYRDSGAIADVYGANWAERFIGLQTWVDAGVPVAINSDHMIGLDPDHAMNSFNPFLQAYIAVARKNVDGETYGSNQRLSRIEALRSITSTAAWLGFHETDRGTLEVGKLADLAVLDRDYFSCEEDDLRRIQVDLTMVGGRVVHERK